MQNIFHFNNLLHSYRQNDHVFWNLVHEVLFNEKSTLPYPDNVTFNIIIDYLGKHNNLSDMFEFFFVMMENGCRPTIITFTSMINAFVKNASFFYKEMIAYYLNYILRFMAFMGIQHNQRSLLAYNKCISRMNKQPKFYTQSNVLI